jgi:hypothetical protein
MEFTVVILQLAAVITILEEAHVQVLWRGASKNER